MKKIAPVVLMLLLAHCLQSQTVKKIVVKSVIKGCITALIPHGKGNENGENWWNEWQKLKKAGKTKKTPATFKNVAKGKYTIVIFNPASKGFDPNSDNPQEKSDGMVFEQVEITQDQTYEAQAEDFKDWNCLSCPWLYVFDGKEYIRQCEIIQDVVGIAAEKTTKHKIDRRMIQHNTLKIRIQEEKEEVSYLNQLVLKIGKSTYYPTAQSGVVLPNSLNEKDNVYTILKKGDVIELEFKIPTAALSAPIILEATGYYDPDKAFLQAIYQQYLKKSK